MSSTTVTIKTQFGGDIRRFTFDEAKIAVGSSLFGVIHSTISSAYHLAGRSFTITYIDEEGDACCVGGDEETREAIRFAGDHSRVLKLNVVLSEKDTAAPVTPRVAPAVAAAVPVLSIEPSTPKFAVPLSTPSSVSSLEVKKQEIIRPKVTFVSDVTIKDGSIQVAGSTIVKEWTIKLIGTAGQRVYLYRASDIVDGNTTVIGNGKAAAATLSTGGSASETTCISIPIIVPTISGHHKLEYQLLNEDGKVVDGDYKLCCDIIVKPEISASFVADITVPDGSDIQANSTILKKWSIRNDGTLQWPIGSLLMHNDGSVIPSELFTNECKGVTVPSAKPNEIVEIGVHFTAPSTSGRHHGEWHLVQPDGVTKFGNDYALWTQINVPIPTLTQNDIISSLPKWMESSEVRATVEKLRPTPSTTTASTSTTSVATTSTSTSTSSSSSGLKPSEIIHEGIICDGCGMNPIRGLRFKCGSCADFDFCSSCEAKGGHNPDHMFIKAKLPLIRQTSNNGRRTAESKATISNNWRAPTPTPATATVTAVATPAPAPAVSKPAVAVTPKSKKPSPPRSQFQADLTLPDGSQVQTGSVVTKRWALTNIGDEVWPEGTKLMFVGGALAPAAPSSNEPQSLSAVPLALPSQTVEVWARVQVPSTPGRHTGYYRLATKEDKRFGHRLWLDIVAVAQPVVTTTAPVPTATATATKLEVKAAAVTTPAVTVVAATPATPAAVALAKPSVVSKYAAELAQLKELGYRDEEMLNELLQAAGGRVQQVVDWLVTPIV
jgi:hypothetical protein